MGHKNIQKNTAATVAKNKKNRMNKLILFVLSFVFAITSYNLLVYTKHHNSNYCAAEIDYVKHGIGELLDHHGLDHLD